MYGIEPVPVVERLALVAVMVKVGADDWAIAGRAANSKASNNVGRRSEGWNIAEQYINAVEGEICLLRTRRRKTLDQGGIAGVFLSPAICPTFDFR